MYHIVDRLESFVADAFVVGVERNLDVLDGKVLDCLEHFMIRLVGRIGEFLLAYFSLNFLYKLNDRLIGFMTSHNAVVHFLVGNDVRAGFDHGNLLLGRSDGNGHSGLLTLLGRGVDDVFPVHHADGNGADGAVPRNIGDREGDRSADHGGDFRRAVGINAHDGGDDGNIVAHILREKRTDGSVDNAGGENRLLAGSALALHKGAGNLADRIELLLKIDGKREKIDAVAGLCRSGRRNVNGGLAVLHHAGAVGELGGLAGADDQRSAGKLCLEYLVGIKDHVLARKFKNL